MSDDESDNVVSLKQKQAERDQMIKEYEQRKKSSVSSNQPILNIPPVTQNIILLTTAVFLLQTFGPSEWNQWMMIHGGFVAAKWSGAMGFDLWALFSPITHILLHGGWLHFLMNVFMLMAFGAGLEKTIGAKHMALTYLCGALGGAAVQLILNPFSPGIVVGASGAISGLFGAILIVMQKMGSLTGGRQVNLKPFIIIWIGISVLFGLIGAPGGADNIAWAAHIGGFLAGFLYAKFLFKRH